MERVRLVYAIILSVCVGGTLIVLGARKSKMELTSEAFEYGGFIPKQYTCDAGFGLDESPPLAITGVPSKAKSLVLICENLESETGLWVHWLVFNLPPAITRIPGAANISALGGIEGQTTDAKNHYSGPCPAVEQKSYYFKLYALDTMLNLDRNATKEKVFEAMRGHILAETDLIGKYKRPLPEDRVERRR